MPPALAFTLLCACAKPSPSAVNDPPSAETLESGRLLYAAQCASCHGPTARGALAKALVPWTKDTDALRAVIRDTMPPQNPALCGEACARDIAAWLSSLPPDDADRPCTTDAPAKRQLRLLTRREYANTVRDLLGGGSAAPCPGTTFVFRANGRRPASVHVAGSFNAWAASVAAGGWAMTLDASQDRYVVTREVPAGAHQYKFVVDGQWLTDDGNPNRAPDGFGGSNSLLTVTCPAQLAVPELSATLPPESRPKGFAFDDSAEAGLVTSNHVEAYLTNAASVARAAASRVPCPSGATRQACAEEFVRTFGRRAFRRALSAEELSRYAAVAAQAADFDEGVRRVVERMLSSPHFLYRSELGAVTPEGTFRLTPFEVASALSYSLWGTMPDDALLDAAEQGRLATAEDTAREARRLLGDRRARQALKHFAAQWLGTERLATIDKAPALFPAFTPELRASMAAETAAFVEHVVFDGTGRFDELLTADYSFVDAPLARLYGLDPPTTLERRALPPVRAAGLLGHAGVLASYAHSDQSSPVKRGVFVREHLLCQDFPVPPANAGGVPRVDPNATTRERFRQHAADPSCRGCHQYIDEVGFGFEAFDAIGQARVSENGRAIDQTGDLLDVERFGAGTRAPFSRLKELGSHLAASQRAKACFATMVFRFTRGRLESEAERCTVQGLADDFCASNGDVRELLVRALADDRFLTRSSEVAP